MWYLASLLSLVVLGCGAVTVGARLDFLWTRADAVSDRIAGRAAVSLLVTALAAGGMCALHAALFGLPLPAVQDEFSYLLAADTFAHGRLANPTHPMWMHFETFHVIWHPTYASKYPPGQGLFLALGQVLAGQPILGAWLSIGLAAAAVTWLLRAVVPRGWSFGGGMLVAVHPLLLNWGDRYWGGGVAMLGSALAAGAFLRLRRAPRARDAGFFGAGLALLAISRPLEGAIVAAPMAMLLLWQILKATRRGSFVAVVATWAPAVLVLAGTALWIGFYDLRVTGHLLEMPYALHVRQYEVAPVLLFLPALPEPIYHHPLLRQYWVDWAYVQYAAARSVPGLIALSFHKLHILVGSTTGFQPVWAIGAIGLPAAARANRAVAVLLAVVGVFVAAMMAETYFHNHYEAPALPLLLAILIAGLHRAYDWRWRDRPVGRPLVGLAIVVYAASLPLVQYLEARSHYPWARERAAVAQRLAQEPGGQLVIVHYGPGHDPHDEWVYNGADIDHAKIVWARDMGAANRELLDYFSRRAAWLVDADAAPPALTSLRPAASAR